VGILDKLKFWKKDGAFAIGDDLLKDDTGLNYDMGLEDQTGLDNQFQHSEIDQSLNPKFMEKVDSKLDRSEHQSPIHQSDSTMELISSKLDTIKAELDSMNQRIKRIEKIAEDSQETKKETVW